MCHVTWTFVSYMDHHSCVLLLVLLGTVSHMSHYKVHAMPPQVVMCEIMTPSLSQCPAGYICHVGCRYTFGQIKPPRSPQESLPEDCLQGHTQGAGISWGSFPGPSPHGQCWHHSAGLKGLKKAIRYPQGPGAACQRKQSPAWAPVSADPGPQ